MDGRVVIEGPDERFASWKEVEKYLLPESLFSEEVSSEDDDSHYGEDLDDSLANLALSNGSSVSSSHSHEGCPQQNADSEPKTFKALRRDTVVAKSPLHSARSSNENLKRTAKNKAPLDAVPNYLRPLFNHILWRINKETNPHQALDSFILLTNDAEKQAIAKKFGIRAKPLEQLRDAVAREDREFRNHQAFNKIEAGEHRPQTANGHLSENGTSNGIKDGDSASPNGRPRSSREDDEADDSDEDVVVYRPPTKSPSGKPVFDPNDFGRGTPTSAAAKTNATAQSNANTGANYTPAPRATPAQRGARGGRGTPNGTTPRGGRAAPAPRAGRGNAFVPRGTYTPPGAAFRGNAAHGGRGSVSPRLANRPLHSPANNNAGGRGTLTRGAQNQVTGNRPPSSNGTPRGGSAARTAPQPPPTDENGLLNPDSYARPPPMTNSLRGGRRKLWEPN